MHVQFDNADYPFKPWKPSMGMVFEKTISFDTETTLIDEARPWTVPAYVLGAAFDGKVGYFIRREHVEAFFEAHRELRVTLHHAAFDLAVVHRLAPDLDIYSWVDRRLVWDTQLLHKLHTLGTEGHVAGGKGQSTLEHCVERHLRIELPKDVIDSRGRPVRTSYGQWLGRPPQDIEPVYLEYLAR